MASIILFAFLFLGICSFVVLTIALWNIFNKSYKPSNSIPFVLVLLFLFLINLLLASNSLRIFGDNLENNFLTVPNSNF